MSGRRALAFLVVLVTLSAGLFAFAQGHGDDAGAPPGVKDPSSIPRLSGLPIVLHSNDSGIAPVVWPVGATLDYNFTYDATVTALARSLVDVENGSRYEIRDPSGTASGSTPASADQEHCGEATGAYSAPCSSPFPFANLTYAGFRPTEAGIWTIEGPSGRVGEILVSPREELTVTLSSPRVHYSARGSFGEVIQVTNITGSPVAGARLFAEGGWIPAGATTDAGGRFSILQSGTPPIGTYVIRAEANVAGAEAADIMGHASLSVSLAPAVITIADGSALTGHDNVTAISISGASDLGALTLTMRYNASIAEVVNVSRGDVPSSTFSWNADVSHGVLHLIVATSDVPGPSGNHVVAYVALRAVSPPGSATRLSLTVDEAVHSNGSALETETRDGTFRAWLPGDVNGDGTLDLEDAQALADYVVGMTPRVFLADNADANQDGRISGLDVMLVRQVAVGTRASIG